MGLATVRRKIMWSSTMAHTVQASSVQVGLFLPCSLQKEISRSKGEHAVRFLLCAGSFFHAEYAKPMKSLFFRQGIASFSKALKSLKHRSCMAASVFRRLSLTIGATAPHRCFSAIPIHCEDGCFLALRFHSRLHMCRRERVGAVLRASASLGCMYPRGGF